MYGYDAGKSVVIKEAVHLKVQNSVFDGCSNSTVFDL